MESTNKTTPELSLFLPVLDEEENLIPGASVELVQDARVERRAITNQDGYVEFPGLRPGTYLARASLDGFVNAEVRSEIPPGKPTFENRP